MIFGGNSHASHSSKRAAEFSIQIEEAYAIVQHYAEVVEKHPGTIENDSLLPAKKDKMKWSLLLLLRQAKKPKRQDWLKVGYLLLANFQPLSKAERAIVAKQDELFRQKLD